MDARSILSTYGVKIINPKTVAYDFHAISSLFHLAFYIRAFAPFELSAPITITHYPGPGGVPIIKHSYYFKPIGNWPPTKDLNPHSVVRSHVSCPVERMGDNWGQGWDLNPRPSGYEPDELPTAPPCYTTLEVPTGLEPVHNGFAIRRLTSLAKEPYRRSLVAERATNPPFTLLRTPHSSCPTGSAY